MERGASRRKVLFVAHPSLPVIVTTAYLSMEPLMSVLDLSHSGYLVKPFDMDVLAARIDAAG